MTKRDGESGPATKYFSILNEIIQWEEIMEA